MRTTTIARAAALVTLGLLAGACAGKEATGPNVSLSLEEVAMLGQELSGVMAINFGSAPARGPMPRLRVAQVLRAATPFNSTWNCTLGGTASLVSTWDTTATTASGDATMTYSSCKTAHYTTSGSLHANGSDTYNQATSVENIHLTASGGLNVAHVDGRTGVCPIDVTMNATESPSTNPMYVVSGGACGVSLSGTY
jgi:hypothetical protein